MSDIPKLRVPLIRNLTVTADSQPDSYR